MCVYASEGWRRPEQGTDFPGAGVPGAGELSSVGGGNLGSSAGAASMLHCRALSLQLPGKNILIIFNYSLLV